jgi:hypothetical protein
LEFGVTVRIIANEGKLRLQIVEKKGRLILPPANIIQTKLPLVSIPLYLAAKESCPTHRWLHLAL